MLIFVDDPRFAEQDVDVDVDIDVDDDDDVDVDVNDPRFAEQEAESQVCARRISAGAKFFRIKQ